MATDPRSSILQAAAFTRQQVEALLRLTATAPLTGAGSPEGVVAAPVGALYTRTDGGAGTTLYVKESGTGATGWVAK